jgi:hypothetical protein
MTETFILLTVYLILLIPRCLADRFSQTSADSTAMRSVNQKFLHAWHIFRIFVLHCKTIDTRVVEQVTILNRVTAGWAVAKTNTNSDHDVLWHLHAHAQCPFSRISARAWRMPFPLRQSASEQIKAVTAHARYVLRWIRDWLYLGPPQWHQEWKLCCMVSPYRGVARHKCKWKH